MTDNEWSTAALIGNCVLQKHREAQETLELNWNEVCILAAIGLSVTGGTPANLSTIASMATLPYSTTSRILNTLVANGWATKIHQKPYPVYLRTNDRAKMKKIRTFVNNFQCTISNTAGKLDKHIQNGDHKY